MGHFLPFQVSSALSVFGDLVVLITFALLGRSRRSATTQTLACFAVADMTTILLRLFGEAPRGAWCDAQAAAAWTFTLASWGWTWAYAYTVRGAFMNERGSLTHPRRSWCRLSPWMHVVCWGCPLVASIAAAVAGLFTFRDDLPYCTFANSHYSMAMQSVPSARVELALS